MRFLANSEHFSFSKFNYQTIKKVFFFISYPPRLPDINPFSTNVLLMQKPGSWFLLAKCLKNYCGRVTF